MDWSEADDFVTIGAVGAKEVGRLFHININSWPGIFAQRQWLPSLRTQAS